MSRIARRREEQRRRLMAYMTDERVPDLEKGWIMVALMGHAFVYLFLLGADAAWIAGTAARVWRRREAGLTEAVRTGVHRPTLAGLLAANLVYTIVHGAGLAALDRRADVAARPPDPRWPPGSQAPQGRG
jgi:hypothetical protein